MGYGLVLLLLFYIFLISVLIKKYKMVSLYNIYPYISLNLCIFNLHFRSLVKLLDGITDSMDLSLCQLRELVMDRDDREAWLAAVHGVTKSRT